MKTPRDGTVPTREQIHIITGLSDYHMVGIADGLRYLECFRCRRLMPETSYSRVHFRARVAYLHPLCHTCREQSRSHWAKHPLYSAKLHRFLTKLAGRMRVTGRHQGIVMGVEAEDLLGLYIAQGGKCALSGKRMLYDRAEYGRVGRGRKIPTLLTVDRIDSAGNYTLGNIQLVCWIPNMMKSDMTMDQLYLWCAAIVLTHSDEKELDTPGVVGQSSPSIVENGA